jgi:acetolactate synthase-1/2/3 large subunit
MQLTGAQALIKSLEMEHTEVIFGLPGGAILPAYDPILDSPIRHVLVRHEQGAGHMAEGYADVTGRPGVVMVTSGPGATNLVTALCDAYMDSVPVVAITGQVARAVIGTDAFQEADTVGITRSVTKHNELVMRTEDIALAVRQAFLLATTGRPGPVLLDIPKDILVARTEWYWPNDHEVSASLPGYKPNIKGHPRMVREAVRLITASQRPVIYAGGGILKARASEALARLAELTNAPVVTTLMARGAFPDSHPQCLGMPGMHGNYAAITSMQESDLLITLGARFDDRVTGHVPSFAPRAKVVHVDIDPAELGKIRRPDVPIVGDCRLVIEELVRVLLASGEPQADRKAWWSQIDDWRARFPLHYDPQAEGELLKPQAVIEAIRDASPPDTTVVSGVGQHQMWASQYWRFDYPNTWVNSGGLGTMGFAVPAAIGAKVGRPDRTVWAIDGDGCFQMTAQELVTASSERIPIKVAI